MFRTIEQWKQIFSKLDATNISAEEAIANRLIDDLSGYHHNSKQRKDDIQQIANAIQAYAHMVQEVGLKF